MTEKKPKVLVIPYTHKFKSGKEGHGELKLIIGEETVVIYHTKPTNGKGRIGIPRHVFDSLIRWGKTKEKKQALTIGYMVRIKPNIRRDGQSNWPEYANRYCITTDMSRSSGFSVLLLPAGHKESDPLELCDEVIGAEVAWIDEDELTFVNCDVRGNMEFYAKCKAEEEYSCPDCGTWNKDRNKCTDPDCENELQCLKCGCVW